MGNPQPPCQDSGVLRPGCPVVCVLASAGGLDALDTLVSRLPGDTGMAFLVLQHDPADQPCPLPERLERRALLPCLRAALGQRPEPDQVLVLTPGMVLACQDGQARLTWGDGAEGSLAPGDGLFRSAAACLGERAMGVILSGTGTDGTAGLRAIQARGGRTFAQDPATAAFAGMPEHAIEAGVVDVVLPVAELPARIVAEAAARPLGQGAAGILPGLRAVLKARTGHDQPGMPELLDPEASLLASAQALQESEQRMDDAMRRSHTGVWEFNVGENSSFRTQEHAEIFGYPDTRSPWTTPLFLDHIVPEDRERVAGIIQTGIRNLSEWSFQCRIRRVDGVERWIRVAGGASGQGPGGMPRMRGIVQDITDQKRAEEEIRRSEERFALAFNASPDAIAISCLATGVYRMVNESFTRILGFQPGDAVGRSSTALELWVDPRDRVLWAEELRATGQVACREITFRRADGQTILTQVSSRLVVLAGEVTQLSVIRDITRQRREEVERRLLEAELEHMQRVESIGRLAGGVAHDMNNVLAAILSVTQALRSRPETSGDLDASLATVERAATRGRDLVRGLSDFSRKGIGMPVALNLNDLVRQEVALLDRTLMQKYRLEIDLEEPLPRVLGETALLGSALMNLCVNAVDAMPERGTLTLRTRQLPEGLVQLEVEDTGEGMSPEVLRKAMEPFFTTKPFGKGTGLGLASVSNTARAHGGTLTLRSEPGHGTQAILQLPIASRLPEAEAAPGPVDTCLGPRNILLVDDDELLRASVPILLRTLGHEVMAVDGGPAALAWLEAGGQPDLVVLDMNMPGMDGSETLLGIRCRRPDLPVLLASGVVDGEVERVVAGHPRLLAIAKPFTLEEIQQKLAELSAVPG